MPLAVFQQLRDRPQFDAEGWLARRIFKHYRLGTAVRKRIRYELLRENIEIERDDWHAALLVLREACYLRGRTVGYCARRETAEVKAEEWYLDVILPSGANPHMLVRSLNDEAKVVWACFTNRTIASVNLPYSIRATSLVGTALVTQDLPAYLGEDPSGKQLLDVLFEGSRDGVPTCAKPDEPEEEDADYE